MFVVDLTPLEERTGPMRLVRSGCLCVAKGGLGEAERLIVQPHV